MRLAFILLGVTITACSNNTSNKKNQINKTEAEETVEQIEPGHKEEITSVSGCYWKIENKDTIAMQLFQTGTTVEGKITFDNYEVDGSSGMVTGTIDGNIIKIWYKFKAEGMNNVAQIYFKKKGNQLFRGGGQYVPSGDSSFYKNEANITYDLDAPFLKVLCDSVPQKYRL